MYLPEDKSEEITDVDTEQSKELDTETSEQSEDTQGAGDQAGEQSAEGFDPKSLTPELQKVYKGMQADYTKKTQGIAESKKSLEVKEQQIEGLREKYEQRLFELTQPKGKEEPTVDTTQMTTEQKQAWDMLNKHFDKKLEQVRSEERKTFEGKLNTIQGQVGDMAWRSFERENPNASKYRPRMRELYQEKGGANCPLNLDELLTLAQKDDLKRLGAEEYRRSVQTKKTKVTTKPGSAVGEEAGIKFDNTPGRSPKRFLDNFMKAAEKADDDIKSGRVKAK